MSTGGPLSSLVGGPLGFFLFGPLGMTIDFFAGMFLDLLSPDTSAPGQPDVAELSMTTAQEGVSISDALGTTKATGNIIWYGKNRVVEIRESQPSGGKGGGGGGGEYVSGYQYHLSWAMGLCAGEVDAIYAIYFNDDLVWTGDLERPGSGGEETITLGVDIDYPDYGGAVYEPEMTTIGSATVYFGTEDQVANADMTAELALDSKSNPAYRGLCYLYFDDVYIGSFNRCPTVKIVFRKTPTYSFSGDKTIGTYDYNAAHALWHVFSDMIGLPESYLNSTAFASVASTLLSDGIGIGVLFNRQQSAETYIESILSHIGGLIRYGNDGTFHAKLLRDDENLVDLPIITEDEMLDDLQLSRSSWLDTINEIKIQYVRRTGEITGADTEWTARTPNDLQVSALAAFNGKLYGLTAKGAKLYEWNDSDAWIEVAPYINVAYSFLGECLQEYNLELYAGTSAAGLHKWNGVNAWTYVGVATGIQEMAVRATDLFLAHCNPSPPAYDGYLSKYNGVSITTVATSTNRRVFGIAVFNGSVYVSTEGAGGSGDGILLVWDEATSLTQAAGAYAGSSNIQNLCVYGGKLYGGTGVGMLLEWDGVSAWTLAAPALVAHGAILSLIVFNSSLYGSSINGGLLKWNDVDAWTEIIDTVSTDSIESIAEYNSRIYGSELHQGVEDTKKLQEWFPGITEAMDFVPAELMIADPANQELVNRISHRTIKAGLFTTTADASWAADRFLKAGAYPLAQVSFPANRDVFRYDPGDLFILTYTAYSISGMVCRVVNLTEAGAESEDITIHAIEDVDYIGSEISWTAAEGEGTGLDTSIDDLSDLDVFEAPYVLAGDELRVVTVACRKKGNELGYVVYISPDNIAFAKINLCTVYTPFGTLVATYGITNAMDDEGSFQIEFSDESNTDIMETITRIDLFEGVNLAVLNGEIISFQTITPVSGTTFQFENILRGRFDTEIVSHAAGERFWFLSSGLFGIFDHSTLQAEEDRYFKMVPYNHRFSGRLSTASGVMESITGRAHTPYRPINLQSDGGGIRPKYTSGNDIVLSWRSRIRGADWADFEATAPPTWEGYFEVEVWVSSVLVRTTTAIDAVTWTYTNAMNVADNGTPASSIEFKLLNYISETGRTYESAQTTLVVTKA